uniref:Uncharacterized protein n=1 Tax=Oryza rufipogon TaxID=4529 RepID=A0A0E0R5W6_ORYRU
MALHRAGLAEQRSSNRALLLSLAHGAFLHPLGQAGSYVQATKRPHRDPAIDVFKDGLQDLIVMCQHVRGTFDNAVVDFRSKIIIIKFHM